MLHVHSENFKVVFSQHFHTNTYETREAFKKGEKSQFSQSVPEIQHVRPKEETIP